MQDNFYAEIVFSLDTYNENRDDMWIDISKQLQVLCRAGYVAKVYADDNLDDIIVIQFHYQDNNLSTGICEWITWEEYATILGERDKDKIVPAENS